MVNSPKRVVAAKKREKKNFMENRTINFQAHSFVVCTLFDATHLSICLRLMKFFYTHYPYYNNPIPERNPRISCNEILEWFSGKVIFQQISQYGWYFKWIFLINVVYLVLNFPKNYSRIFHGPFRDFFWNEMIVLGLLCIKQGLVTKVTSKGYKKLKCAILPSGSGQI